MKRKIATYKVENINKIKQQMLSWANQFNICCLLDNNNYINNHSSFEFVVAVGFQKTFTINASLNGYNDLKLFLEKNNDWLFGNIGYDFKNHLFSLTSNKTDHIQFPDLFLFQPEVVITLVGNFLNIQSLTKQPSSIFQEILLTETTFTNEENKTEIKVKPKIKKEEYIEIISKLKNHLQMGDCYEINFCQEFFSENTTLNPLNVYTKLNKISPTPFGAYYKLNDKYLLCASPERFIKKNGENVISQPIKGTAKRDLLDFNNDEKLKNELLKSQKERSENVMIVDLVRNDLSKIANKGSVKVEEFLGLHTYPQVHQMESTISANINSKTNLAYVLQALFPMGSMTGAPKFKVMQLIEQYEQTKRGIYSGSLGYITPQNDFDFNVVIRSIMYNQTTKYANYLVGSAITHYSNAIDEYEECLLKAKAMELALN